MAVSLNLPFGEFAMAAMDEYCRENNLPKLSKKLAIEQLSRLQEEWSKAKKERAKRPTKAFVPPTAAEVEAYSISIGWPLDGASWVSAYQQKDWYVGKTRMKDWKAAVRHWKHEQIHTKITPRMPTNGHAKELAQPPNYEARWPDVMVGPVQPWESLSPEGKKYVIELFSK
jgi:hypothetical protein